MLGPWFVFPVSLACSFVLWKGNQEELRLPLLPSCPERFTPRVEASFQGKLAIVPAPVLESEKDGRDQSVAGRMQRRTSLRASIRGLILPRIGRFHCIIQTVIKQIGTKSPGETEKSVTQSGYSMLSRISSFQQKWMRHAKIEKDQFDPYTGKEKVKTGYRNSDSDQISDWGGK